MEVLEVPEGIRCVLLCMLEAVKVRSVYGGVGGVGGDTLYATLYAGGCGGLAACRRCNGVCYSVCWRLWKVRSVYGGVRGVGGAGGDTLHATMYAGGCGRYVLLAGGVAGTGGDTPCATLYAGGCGFFGN